MNKENNISEKSNEGIKDINYDRFKALEESVNDIFTGKSASQNIEATGVFDAVRTTPLFDYSDTAPTLEYARPQTEYKMGDTQDIELPKMPSLESDQAAENEAKSDLMEEYDNLSKLFELDEDEERTDSVSFDELDIKTVGATSKKILANDEEIANVFSDNDFTLRANEEPAVRFGKNKKVLAETDREEKYESADDAPEAIKKLKLRVVSSLSSMFFVFLLTLACFYVEFAPSLKLPHFAFLEPGRYGAVYALICLQLVYFACMLCIDSVYFGAAKLLHGRASAQSCAPVIVLIVTIHTVFSAIFRSSYTDMPLFCSVACFSILLLSVYEFFKTRNLLLSFRVASASTDKFVVSGDYDENTASFVPQDLKITEVKKTRFINDFFKKNNHTDKYESKISLVMLIAVGLGIVCGIAYGIINKNAFMALNSAVAVMLTVIPCGVFLAGSLPQFLFVGSSFKQGTALVGAHVPEEYEQTELLAFDDTEVFSPSSVKVSSIRTYGNTRIDNAIIVMAKAFSAIGGPLCEVFRNSLQNINISADVSITDVASDGLWLRIDSENVFIGSGSYFAANGFDAPVDNIDASFEQSLGSIIYLAVNNQLAAKFYIKYTLSLGFESMLSALKQNGISAAIKTYDPCINNEFLKAHLDSSDYSICVIKGDCEGRSVLPSESSDAMLVSVHSERQLLKTFLRLQKLRMAANSNFFLILAGAILGFIISALLLFVSSADLGAGFVLIFQLFWLLALTLVSFIYK